MEKPIVLLRLSYWIAALADFGIAALAWIPERMGTAGVNYPMGLTSVIAFSWGVMLLLADRKPMQRRWILVPTILVVALITVIRTRFALMGTVEPSPFLLVFAIALVVLMTYSFWQANKHAAGS